MNVTCIEAKCNYPPLVIPYELGKRCDENNFVASSEGYTIRSDMSGYSVTKGAEYEVYGVLLYLNQIRYLIADDNGIPGFFPHCLFKIKNSDMFWGWQAGEYSVDGEKLLVFGYPDIAQDYAGLRDLINGTNKSIGRFLKFKEFVKNFSM